MTLLWLTTFTVPIKMSQSSTVQSFQFLTLGSWKWHQSQWNADCPISTQVIFVRWFSRCQQWQCTRTSTRLLFVHDNWVDFSRLLCKIQRFEGLEFGPIKFKVFKIFKAPYGLWHLISHAAIWRQTVPSMFSNLAWDWDSRCATSFSSGSDSSSSTCEHSFSVPRSSSRDKVLQHKMYVVHRNDENICSAPFQYAKKLILE